MLKRMLCCLLAVLCVGAYVPPVRAADDKPEALLFDAAPPAIPTAGDVWDGTTEQPTKLVKKDGVNYYEITKCSQLAYVAQTGGDWLARNYLLAKDLILNKAVLEWNDVGELTTDTGKLKQWTPIGSESNPFTGKFDGGGHTVSGLYINYGEYSGRDGLFGYSKGTITAVTIVNAHVKGGYDVSGVCGYNDGGTVTDCVFFGRVIATHTSYSYVGGICGGGNCTNCVNYGAITGSTGYVGGVCGGGDSITNCMNYGTVTGTSKVGGIVGSSGYVSHCANHGAVTGSGENIGGVCGYSHNWANVDSCSNYGTVTGKSKVGGVCGDNDRIITGCANYGAVSGKSNVGGVCGSGNPSRCANYGTVTGESNVGGVCGSGGSINCYNTAAITGKNTVGGVCGSDSCTNCYNRGNVKCTAAGNNAGAIVGSDGAVWDKDKITGCHYLRTDKINTGLYGCGGVSEADMEPDGFFANTAEELKNKATYKGWDFSEAWAISSTRNSGYPYLVMEDDLPGGGGDTPTELTALTLSDDSLSLRAGDTAYLSVTPSPENAALPTLTWKSDKTAVATVNSSGCVTAVGAGTAKITVTGGGFSAVCTVTVTAREANEYRINGVTLRSASGAELTKIPKGSFFATVSVTKLTDGGDTLILLASYTASGQYQGMLYLNMSGIQKGSTVEFTLPVDNSAGNIAQLKAFSIASFSDLTPLGTAVSFPEQ